MSDVGALVSLDKMPTEASSVVLDYTSRDFTAIRAQLIGIAKGKMPTWETAGEAPDFGTLLIELFAYMGDVMHYYIDRTASEAFISTCQRRTSMLYIADMFGYVPIGQHGAIVQLTFTLDPEATENVTLAKGTRIHNKVQSAENLVVFELEDEVTLYARDPTPEDPSPRVKKAFATEGVSVRDEKLGTSAGVPNMDLSIKNKGVIYQTLQIVSQEGLGSTTWSFTSDLSLARPTQAAFTTYIDESDITHVVFGDNASGRIPSSGAVIYANYRYGVGVEANDVDIGDLEVIVPIDDTDVFDVAVSNEASPVGGADPESIESMRYAVPRGSLRMKQRAVTLNDYADLSMQVPGVGKAISYGTVYTAVHVRIAPTSSSGSDPLMESLCHSVESYMEDKILVGSRVYAEPRDYDSLFDDVTGTGNIYIRATVHVMPTYNRTAVRKAVETALRNMLSYDLVNFGMRITIGQVYRAILGVQGVEWADLNWLQTERPTDPVFTPEPGEPSVGQEVTALFTATYQYSNVTTIGDPGTRHFRLNDWANPTIFAFSKTDDNLTDRTTNLMALKIGDHFVMRLIEDPTTWKGIIVTGNPTDSGTWMQIAVAVSTSVGPGTSIPGNNDKVLFDFARPAPSPDVDPVINIETPELLLTRIEPTKIVESATDPNYPDWTEDERTHDGLWIQAVGGTPNS
jgi:Baseplate J-like protein